MVDHALIEVPPLSDQDSFIITERRETSFTSPIHIHTQFELNYIENAPHAQRIVGDHVAEIEDLELVLITGSNLEHAWTDYRCRSKEIIEITVQFNPTIFVGGLFGKRQFVRLNRMLAAAESGLAFSRETILAVRPLLHRLPGITEGFEATLAILQLMYLLSQADDTRILSQRMCSDHPIRTYDSRRVQAVMDYLSEHYREPIQLHDVSSLIHMSETSFCRFIKRRMGMSFVACLNEIRVHAVSRLLLDEPTCTVADIAGRCGFNNLANFNRIFKRLQGMPPQAFRAYYMKRSLLV